MDGTHVPALPPPSAPSPTAHPAVVFAGSERKGLTVPTAPPPILSSKPTAMTIWAAFRRRWRMALSLSSLVGAVAAAVAWYLASPLSYTVATTLHVDATDPIIAFQTREGRTDFAMYQRGQIARVRSRLVFNSALNDTKVAHLAIVREQADPLEWLSKEVQADFSISPETLRISMIGRDADALIVLVDAIREAYLKEEVNKERTKRLDHLEQLKKVQIDYEDHLKSRRKVVRALAEDLSSKSTEVLAKRQELALAELARLRTQLSEMRFKLLSAKTEAEAQADLDKTLQQAEIPEALIDEVIRKDPLVVGYQKDIQRLEKILGEFRKMSAKPEANGVYVQRNEELASTQKLLEERKADLVPQVTEELRARRQTDSERSRAEKAREVAMLEKMVNLLADQVSKMEKDGQTFGKKTIDLNDQEKEIALIEDLSKRVGADVEVLRVELQAPTRMSTEDTAYATKRDSLGIKAACGAGFGGFGVVLFGILFLEFRARRLADAEEVSQGLRLPVIGLMPRVRPQQSRSVTDAQAVSSQRLLIESVDAARAVILHASQQTSLRVVMITSAVGGEGKTMLAAHLSASMARAGCRALLVDADFRRPSLQTVFGLAGEAGLSEVLRGEATLRAVMQSGPIEGLSVISTGQCDSRAMQALARGALRGLFEEIKGEFDLIIVDSAPVLPVVDSQLIAQAVDGVILSVLRDVSRLPLIHAAYERLMLFQVRLLGAVVHGEDVGAYGFQYPNIPITAAKAAAPVNPE